MSIFVVTATFASVMGTKSKENTDNLISPLFNIRTRSATNDEKSILTTSNFIGQNSGLFFNIGSSLKTNQILEKIVISLKEMSNEQFADFLSKFSANREIKKQINEKEIDCAIQLFNDIRTNKKTTITQAEDFGFTSGLICVPFAIIMTVFQTIMGIIAFVAVFVILTIATVCDDLDKLQTLNPKSC